VHEDEQQRHALLERLTEEYLEGHRSGRGPSVEELARRHPEVAGEIHELFPMLALLEHAAGETDEDEGGATGLPDFPGMDVLEEIGRGVGGMGRVYRARERSLDRTVAIKVTRAHLDSPEGRSFFEGEARAAGRLEHPGIVKVYSFHPDHVPPYYVMQFVEGRTLREACAGRPAAWIAQVMEKVARALSHAHEQGIVHRDIKPENVLVDFDGEPHITDFGLARDLDEVLADPRSLDVTSPRGTPNYIAPEVYAGTGRAGPRADVYAFGVTLFAVLTGRLPFAADALEELRAAVVGGSPPLPQTIDAAIPEPLQRICLKAMERDPEHRYSSARNLADDLARFVAGREVYARPTSYLSHRRGRLLDHMTEIRLWGKQRILERRQSDLLLRPYQRILDDDTPWEEPSRRIPWETIASRVGGWSVVVSCALWPAFYWDRLDHLERVLATVLPCLLIALCGWIFHRRGSTANAVSFLLTACALVPLSVGTVLTEYELLRWPQAESLEVFGEDAVGQLITKPADAEPTGAESAQRAEPPAGFAPTNTQLLASAGAFLACALALLLFVRARLFALWVSVGIYSTCSSALLLWGLWEWLQTEEVARALAWMLPISLAFVPIALLCLRRDRQAWAGLFYPFFVLPFAAILTALAFYGSREWIGAEMEWSARSVQHWLMANGVVYALAHVLHVRSRRWIVRVWGEFFPYLFAGSLVVPLHVLFDHPDGPFLGMLGEAELTIYELVSIPVCLGLMSLGTWARNYVLALSGLAGMGVFLVRGTERHFLEDLTWPLSLAVGGVVLLAAGAYLSIARRMRTT
jgi:serine/threonine protein kinase